MAKILIIEDHPSNMKLAADLLKGAGYEVLGPSYIGDISRLYRDV